MDLIDDIDFIGSLIWFESGFFDEFTDIFDSIIRSTIDLDDIEHRLIIGRETVHACMAWISLFWTRTVQYFREDTCTRRLAGSTRSMKEVRMMDTSCGDTIFEDSCDVILTDD